MTDSPTQPATEPLSASTPGGQPEQGTIEAVRADLQTFVTTLERDHKGLFTYVPEAEWRAAVQRLDDLIPELVPDHPERLMVEFMRLVALPGVAGGRHGHVGTYRVESAPVLGLVTYTFADGIYVTRATAEQQELVGKRVTAIGERPIDEVRALVEPLVPRDNAWGVGAWLVDYLLRPDVLLGLGIIEAIEPVEVTVEGTDGQPMSFEVDFVDSHDQLQPQQPRLGWLSEVDHEFAVFHYLPERPEALWTSQMGRAFWWTIVGDGTTLYVQQNLVDDADRASRPDVIAAASNPSVERVILDIRHNRGGDDSTWVIETFRDPALNQPGRIFVITSNNVFSAAMFIADELDLFSQATLVGEPIGGAPGFLAGASTITLAGLPIPLEIDIPRTSPLPSVRGITVEPDIAVPLTGADYFSGRDAAMEAIMSYQP